MADAHVSLRWTGEALRFEAEHPSHNSFRVDGDGVTAHSPVQALLLALAGCMAADVVDIVGKMRLGLSALDTIVTGERNAEPPRYFREIHIRFVARGVAADDRDKLERAIQLSHDKYCSVFHSLRKDIAFSSELSIE